MNQKTKSLNRIKLRHKEISSYKEKSISQLLKDGEEVIIEHVKSLQDSLNLILDKKEFVYIYNKDAYYLPEIVALVPNLSNFTCSVQNNNEKFRKPTSNQMHFSGFFGKFPTVDEVKRCFSGSNLPFIEDGVVKVNGVSCSGITCVAEHDNIFLSPFTYSFYFYNISLNKFYKYDYDDVNELKEKIKNIFVKRTYKRVEFDRDNISYNSCNIPFFHLNGLNSKPITLQKTIFYFLKNDLLPQDLSREDEKNFIFVQKTMDYLDFDNDEIHLNIQKLRRAIEVGVDLTWLFGAESTPLTSRVLGGEKLINTLKEDLLHVDEYAVALKPYDEKLLTDPNRGHWDLWDIDSREEENVLSLDLGTTFIARNPAADVSDGIVAIDLGTKSTVVVCETGEQKILPLPVGSSTDRAFTHPKDYENPTLLQFIDIDSFRKAYSAEAGRPRTRWEDLTVSHNAVQNLREATSEQAGTFFEGLKQWCGTSGERHKLSDRTGKVWELPPFMDLTENDTDPLEIYSYYLGRYINNMSIGKIFLHYVMSFPVTYAPSIRDRMERSMRRGLMKSLPISVQADENMMKRFCLQQIASEPAAYAITALKEYGFVPEGEDKKYYAVFDFGGGTTDFDFGVLQESDDDRYDYVLIHFGENGDRTLGGENLLRLMAFEVFRVNSRYLRNPDGDGELIPFLMPADAEFFTGYEGIVKNSSEAQQNMRNLMEKLRPVWESPESEEAEEILSSGQIQLTLFRENGEKKTDACLKLETGEESVDLIALLRDRIEKGIERFFIALGEAFDKNAVQDDRIDALSDVQEISIFLAGNSSRSQIVREIFYRYVGLPIDEADEESGQVTSAPSNQTARTLLRFGDTQPMPKFTIYPPLGTEEAEDIRSERGIVDDRERGMRPTGKTGVAFGLLKCRGGGEIKVESIAGSASTPFQYYVGRRKKGEFRLIIDRSTNLNTWYKFIDASGPFDLLYTDRPEAASGNAPMTIAKQKHIILENADPNAFVFVRPIESHAIEYVVVKDKSELRSGTTEQKAIRLDLE